MKIIQDFKQTNRNSVWCGESKSNLKKILLRRIKLRLIVSCSNTKCRRRTNKIKESGMKHETINKIRGLENLKSKLHLISLVKISCLNLQLLPNIFKIEI